MPKFNTAYDIKKTDPTPAGDPKGINYVAVTLPSGGRILKESGSYNIPDYINSFKDSVLLENVLKTCMITGDNSALNQREGYYLDLSEMPQSFADVQNQVVLARSFYENAPADVKSKYPSFEAMSDAMLSDPSSDAFKGLMAAFGVLKDSDTSVVSSTSIESEVVSE